MVEYSSIKPSMDNTHATIEWEGKKIKVYQYSSIANKNNIVQLALQNSREDWGINTLKSKMLFDLYIVFYYTDIVFSKEEKEDVIARYDEIYSCGLLGFIKEAMDLSELKQLDEMYREQLDIQLKYNGSFASAVRNFLTNLPISAERASEIISNFNPADYQKVLDFARAANGGREIN